MTEKTTVEPFPREQAFALLDSLRGRYVISQALYYGIWEMSKVPVPHEKELSDTLNDMELLRKELFDFPIQRIAINNICYQCGKEFTKGST